MEKYFVFLLLVSSAGYTRGAGPYTKMMTCYDCAEILSGQLDPNDGRLICDGNYSKSKAKSIFSHRCLTVNRTITSNVPNDFDKATILERSIGWGCNFLESNVGVNSCSDCKRPRCNYPLPKATNADMIECYECEDKDIISPCDEKNISESKTTKKDGRIYSCYIITTYDDDDEVKNYDRFIHEKDFCKELKEDMKYSFQKPDCKECNESRCNTDGYSPTRSLTTGLNQTPYFLFLYLIPDIIRTDIPIFGGIRGPNSASKIVLKYFYVIYFTLYCGQYKYISFLRRLY